VVPRARERSPSPPRWGRTTVPSSVRARSSSLARSTLSRRSRRLPDSNNESMKHVRYFLQYYRKACYNRRPASSLPIAFGHCRFLARLVSDGEPGEASALTTSGSTLSGGRCLGSSVVSVSPPDDERLDLCLSFRLPCDDTRDSVPGLFSNENIGLNFFSIAVMNATTSVAITSSSSTSSTSLGSFCR
jgi:hypothetical protein